MRKLLIIGLMLIVTGAQALRCDGGLVRAGDTVARLMTFCGKPTTTINYPLSPRSIYIYEKPGRLIVMVVVESGIIESIE